MIKKRKEIVDMKFAKKLCVYGILKGYRLVARVHVYYGGNRTLVDILQHTGLQQGSASGHGFDTATAAMAGLNIDGITLHNHGEVDPETGKAYPAGLSALKEAGYTVWLVF